jgi:hypothetical protein
MTTPWETEPDESQPISASVSASVSVLSPEQKGGFEVKAYLVLVDSDTEDCGIVEDTNNDILWVPGQGTVVGDWSKPRYDDLIHISLATPISALQDRSIQTFAAYAERRRLEKLGGRKSSTSPKIKKVKVNDPTPEPIPEPEISLDEHLAFNSMKARLGRVK